MDELHKMTKIEYRLRDLRQAHGMTQKEAEDYMGWPVHTWSELERGERNPIRSAILCQEITRKFGVEPAYLQPKPKVRALSKTGRPHTVTNRFTALRRAGWSDIDIAIAIDMSVREVVELRELAELRGMNKRYTMPAESIIQLLTNTPDISTHAADDFIPAGPVREHLLKLEDAGYGRVHHVNGSSADRDGLILKVTSAGRDLIRALFRITAERQLVRADLAQEILSLPTDINARIPSPVGASRRLRALVAWGYEPAELQETIGLTDMQINRVLWADCEAPLERGVGVNLVKTFSRLEHIKGKSENAIKMAEENDWALPFQWDEYTIDKATGKRFPRRRGTGLVYGTTPEKRAEYLQMEFEELLQDLRGVA